MRREEEDTPHPTKQSCFRGCSPQPALPCLHLLSTESSYPGGAGVGDGKPRLVKDAAGVEENGQTEPEGAEATRKRGGGG